MSNEDKQEEKSKFTPNQDRYAIASRPHACESDAGDALNAFFTEVSKLREKHQVPEVVIVAVAYHINADEKEPVTHSAAFGDKRLSAALAAAAYGTYTASVIEQAKYLESLAAGSGRAVSK